MNEYEIGLISPDVKVRLRTILNLFDRPNVDSLQYKQLLRNPDNKWLCMYAKLMNSSNTYLKINTNHSTNSKSIIPYDIDIPKSYLKRCMNHSYIVRDFNVIGDFTENNYYEYFECILIEEIDLFGNMDNMPTHLIRDNNNGWYRLYKGELNKFFYTIEVIRQDRITEILGI